MRSKKSMVMAKAAVALALAGSIMMGGALPSTSPMEVNAATTASQQTSSSKTSTLTTKKQTTTAKKTVSQTAVKQLNQYAVVYHKNKESGYFSTCIASSPTYKVPRFIVSLNTPYGSDEHSGVTQPGIDAIGFTYLRRTYVYTAEINGITSEGKLLKTQTLKLFSDPMQKVGKVQNNKIKVSWEKQVGASGYVVYGSTDGKHFTAIKHLDKNATSYTVTKVNGKAVKKTGTYYIYVASKVVDHGKVRYSYKVSPYNKDYSFNASYKTNAKRVVTSYYSSNFAKSYSFKN